MVIAMATSQAYLGTHRTNPIHYRKFNLSQIAVYRNGQPIVGTPVSTNFNQRIYFNTLKAMDFVTKWARDNFRQLSRSSCLSLGLKFNARGFS